MSDDREANFVYIDEENSACVPANRGVEELSKSFELDAVFGSKDSRKEVVIWDKDERGLGIRLRRNCKPVWIVQWRQNGTSIKRKVGCLVDMNYEQALEQARRRRREYLRIPKSTRGKKENEFHRFAKTFLKHCRHQWRPNTFIAHTYQVKSKLIPYFGEKPISEITQSDIYAWRASPGGHCNRSLSVLSSIFHHAETLGLRPFESNPCTGMRRKKSQFRAIYPSEADYLNIGKALFEKESEHPTIVALIKFMALTGSRRGEVLGLVWDDIDGSRARLRESKSGPSVIWLAKSTRELLDALPKGKPNSYVFSGKSRKDLNAKLTNFWRAFRKDLKLGQMRIHDLRHGYASTGVSSGEELRVVGRLLGHRDPNTTLAYAHLQNKFVVDAAQRVSQKLDRHLNEYRKPAAEIIFSLKDLANERDVYSYLDGFIRERMRKSAC